MAKIYNATPPEAIGVVIKSASVDTVISPAFADTNVWFLSWTLEVAGAMKFDSVNETWVADDDYGVIPASLRFTNSIGENGTPDIITDVDATLAYGLGWAVLPYGGVIACVSQDDYEALIEGGTYIKFELELEIEGEKYRYVNEYITDGSSNTLRPGETGTAVLSQVEII